LYLSKNSGACSLQILIRFLKIYTLWLASAIIALVTAYYLVQVAIDIAFISKANPWQIRAISNFSFVIFGLGCLVLIIGSEGYFRKYLTTDLQPRVIVYLFGTEITILFLAFLADTLII
jgi:hypothetical protein